MRCDRNRKNIKICSHTGIEGGVCQSYVTILSSVWKYLLFLVDNERIVDFPVLMIYHEIMGAICHKDKGVCLLK